MSTSEEMAPGEIARTLGRLDEGQKELVRAQREGQQAVMSELALMRGEFVNHREWEMQNRATDGDITDAHKSISSLKRALVGVVAFVVTSVLGIITAYIQSGRL